MVTLTDEGKSSLDKVVGQYAVDNTTPGFVLGATNIDEEIYFNTGGSKIYNDPSSGEIDQDSIFRLCSMTKLFTHIAALQLIEQGKLSPKDPVSKYLPQFSKTVIVESVFAPKLTASKEATNPVLVENLLNFTSGLFYHVAPDFGTVMSDAYSLPHIKKDDPHGEFLTILQGDLPGILLCACSNVRALFQHIPLAFEPGTDFIYGFSSDVLGFVVEEVTGKTLDAYMKENIFKPLGIDSTSFFLTPELKEKILPLYLRAPDNNLHLWDNQPGTRFIVQDPTKVSRLLGGVGMYGSLRDYLTLLRHLLQVHDGKAKNPILKQETVKAMFVSALPEKGGQSLDFMINSFFSQEKGHAWSNAIAVCGADYSNRRKKGTGFWSGWAGTHFFIDPSTGVAGVFGVQIMGGLSGAGDPASLKVLNSFEETLYANLV